MSLDASQQSAVDKVASLQGRVFCVTGPAGSGKTFTLKSILQALWSNPRSGINPKNTYLCAPTGRAAKMISKSFPEDGDVRLMINPSTIHRMLGYRGGDNWGYNQHTKMDAMLVVIDESSMADSLLLSRVIAALPRGCILLMVGDYEQLAPVSPGKPFSDILRYGPVNSRCRLIENHRQAEGSLIADACEKILRGEMITFGSPGKYTLGGTRVDDLFFSENEEKEDIPYRVLELCRKWAAEGKDYLVVSPQKGGPCGVENMNIILQDGLNPVGVEGKEIRFGTKMVFRIGDKVMQTVNNYDLDVFNGDTGVIVNMDPKERIMIVEFEGAPVVYSGQDLSQLTLGYCLTIHKSQGATVDNGVVILHSSHYYMLSRNLFYTAVSRFREELHVVGNNKAIKRSITHSVEHRRNTLLKLELEKSLDPWDDVAASGGIDLNHYPKGN